MLTDVRGDEDHERRAQVAHPPQVALPGAREHERGRGDRRDAQVGDRAVGHLALPAHERDEPGRGELRRAAISTTPMASASHCACAPMCAASSSRPAPWRRATWAVVP